MRVLISLPHTDYLGPALAFAEAARQHELWLAPGAMSAQVLDELSATFAGLIAPERILPPGPALAGDSHWSRAAQRALHAYSLTRHAADGIFHSDAGLDPQQAAAALDQSSDARAKPRLAYVSPLPPERSGIADYSAELLPELARHYEITVILCQEKLDCPWVEAELPVRDVAWFQQHAEDFDRVLYHIGNSPMHAHMFALLESVPGVVVLHDFYLSNILHHLQERPGGGAVFDRAAFDAHGYSGLLARARQGLHDFVWSHPCNQRVLRHAGGVIVHSAYARQLACQWYGPGADTGWAQLPLLRAANTLPERAAARAALGLNEDDFLVCSFGLLGPTKLNHRLLAAWQASPLARDSQAHLVFVGENDGGRYGQQMTEAIAHAPRAKISGYVDSTLYHLYLAACDAAVQLRSATRGETSAAVLDCLLAGVATIANAHGAMAELPSTVLLQLDDCFDDADLCAALVRLRGDAALRARLGQAGAAYLRAEHAPAPVGERYAGAIEGFYRQHPRLAYTSLLQRVAQLGPGTPAEMAALAAAVAEAAPPNLPRRLYVDVSAMVQRDLKTGIQRVVRAILMALLDAPPAGYRIEPVYTRGGGTPYRYARQWMAHALELHAPELEDAPIDARAGDIFLGIDLFMQGTYQNEARLRAMAERGVQLHFVVYDILPLLRPDCFPYGAEDDFRTWVEAIARVAHGLTCISGAVADELHTWLQARPPQRATALRIGAFHLGADIDASQPSTGLPEQADSILAALAARPTVLMVGTVEPRKAHRQALAAFELLWARGIDVNLVIVGKLGWMMEDFENKALGHAEYQRRLFWLQGISDEMLLKVYAASDGLLAASEGEGFGLPLIEAAQHGLPILARGLPVFREVTGAHASYFDGLEASDLAGALADWLAALAAGTAPRSEGMPWLTWADSAGQLLDCVLGGKWRHTLPPA
ncbi:glycosyltransferase [Massilia sp. TS11]|uniref:glycosyltransferase n=1 Tax=Massilia sp. TS11 TaxID=2908003 RepID=UPI001EDA95A9|nr:glycosyltransferase [Massilia sp. TS11]MCG2583619.1 glycosyltransferase [Massilia sp. TS11]